MRQRCVTSYILTGHRHLLGRLTPMLEAEHRNFKWGRLWSCVLNWFSTLAFLFLCLWRSSEKCLSSLYEEPWLPELPVLWFMGTFIDYVNLGTDGVHLFVPLPDRTVIFSYHLPGSSQTHDTHWWQPPSMTLSSLLPASSWNPWKPHFVCT